MCSCAKAGPLPAAADDANALRFVACGQPLAGHQIRLVDSTGYEVSEREEGRLEFKGPSATSGYYRNPEQTRRLFHDGWLDSGDLAYMAGNDVYITGRVKDIIIRAGRNIYPHELEEAIGNLPGIRKGASPYSAASIAPPLPRIWWCWRKRMRRSQTRGTVANRDHRSRGGPGRRRAR